VLRACSRITPCGAWCANLSSFLPEVDGRACSWAKVGSTRAADGHVTSLKSIAASGPVTKGGVVVIGHLSSASAQGWAAVLPGCWASPKSLYSWDCGRTGMFPGGASPAKAEDVQTLTDSANPHLQAAPPLLGSVQPNHRLCGRAVEPRLGRRRPVRASDVIIGRALDEMARTGGGGRRCRRRRDPGGNSATWPSRSVEPCAVPPAPTPCRAFWHEPCAGIARPQPGANLSRATPNLSTRGRTNEAPIRASMSGAISGPARHRPVMLRRARRSSTRRRLAAELAKRPR